ncbi:MAG: SURF1 family cytochrome oxidase biogenesis protein [Microbacteriaceae bacterium]
MLKVMLRPKWIAALLLVFALATVFVVLSNWQFSRANDNAEVVELDFDTLKELAPNQEPNAPIQETVAAHRVTVTGHYAQDEPLLVVVGKGFLPLSAETAVGTDDASLAEIAKAGRGGSWVVARFEADGIDGGPVRELAVVIGWAESSDRALELLPEIQLPSGEQTLEGRFYPVEAVITDRRIESVKDAAGGQSYLLTSVALASMMNLWEGPLSDARYNGYLVGEFSYGDLREIETRAPENEVHLNILNIFYAAEWIFFAGFAGYIWYRLVRDEYQAEQEALETASADSNGTVN